jgi:hypothetical protein
MTLPSRKSVSTAFSSDQLLLDCLCLEPGHTGKAQLAEMAELDWERLMASATKHGVRPLLYERLSAVASSMGVPDAVLVPLRESFLMNSLRNGVLYRDLRAVLEVFQQQSIPVIVLKGAHLAQLVYKSIGSRQMADTDLLVRPDDLRRAAEALLAGGYACELEPGTIEAWRIQHPGSHHLPYFTNPPHPRIELHWTIGAPPSSREAPDVWAEAGSAHIAGVITQVLSPEDLLIHLCLHSRRHWFSQGLRPVCDLSAAVRHYQGDLNWSKVVAKARAWRAERWVHLGLWLGKTLLQAPVPEAALTALQPDGLEDRWAALTVDIVLSGAEAPPELAYALSFLNQRPGWGSGASLSGRVKYFIQKIIPSRAYMSGYMAQKYSLPLSPLRRYTCYLTRALDFVCVSGRLAWQWVGRGQSSAGARRLHWSAWLDGSAS